MTDRASHWRRRKRLLVVAGGVIGVAAAIGVLDPFASSLPDFSQYEAGPARKLAFITYLEPLVEEENAKILAAREKLQAIAEKSEPGWLETRWLRALAEEYKVVTGDATVQTLLDELLLRVDIVPASLALAQAAKESGWGSSRFALKGNSLYGEWCYSKGCGLVPQRRAEALSHEVRSFRTPQDSLRSYLMNINTHDSYAEFRNLRKRHREMGRTLRGLELADTLVSYSERQEAYLRDIKNLIIFNNLHTDQGIPGAAQ